MRKIPYKEGDVLVVPLRESGFALGVIARMAKGGRILLGYFFGPRRSVFPSIEDASTLRSQDAIKIVMFGDLSLINGEWKIIHHVENWDRTCWPMPKFVREEPIKKLAWLVTYADGDPSVEVSKDKCDFGIAGYERDALCGAGAVEIILTKLLQ